MTGRLFAIGALLLLNALFVAVEFALAKAKRPRLEAMTRSGDRLARLGHRATRDLPRMLSASQLGVSITSLALGWLAIETLLDAFGPDAWWEDRTALLMAVLAAAVLVLAVLHVLVAELIPRAAALSNPERVARWLGPWVIGIAALAQPIVWFIERATRPIHHRLGVPPPLEESGRSPEELRILVEKSEERGHLESVDAALVRGVFEFSEKTAREVMTPRTEIVAIPVEATLDEAIAIIEENQRSRYPVFDESIDDVIGIVLAKDLMPVLYRRPPQFSMRTMMRPAHLVPGSREVEDVLADFKRLKEHMAIVLDEYGGTAGLVTMEDLLEEIVGEIWDEYDQPEEAPVRIGADEISISGTLNIGELNERYGLEVPDEHHTTIGGYVFGTLGRLPVAGDRVTAGGAVFTVREMAGRRIETLAMDLRTAGDRRARRPAEADDGA